MKRSAIGFSFLILSLSVLNLSANVERVKLSVLGQYIDAGKLLRKAILLGRSPDNGIIIDMVVDSIKVGEIPLAVLDDPKATVEDYFDTTQVREFIKSVLTDLANKSLTAEKFGGYLGIVRAAIFKGKKGVPDTVGHEEADRTLQFLDNFKEYLTSGVYKEVNFFEFIDADKGMPMFLETMIQGYFDLRGARSLFENPSQISVESIFKYTNFELLFRDKPNPKELSEGLKLSIQDVIGYIEKPEKNVKDFIKLLRAII